MLFPSPPRCLLLTNNEDSVEIGKAFLAERLSSWNILYKIIEPTASIETIKEDLSFFWPDLVFLFIKDLLNSEDLLKSKWKNVIFAIYQEEKPFIVINNALNRRVFVRAKSYPDILETIELKKSSLANICLSLLP